MDIKRKKILISTSDQFFNADLMKKLRLSKPYSKWSHSYRKHMSANQVSIKIGVSKRQVNRYESSSTIKRQYPPLKKFKNICLLFQVDPIRLLNLTWIPESCVNGGELLIPETDYHMKISVCPHCKSLILDNDPIYERKSKQLVVRRKTKK